VASETNVRSPTGFQSAHPDSFRLLKGRSVIVVIPDGSLELPGGGGGGGEVAVSVALPIFPSLVAVI
jgi:hypothetical protein